MATQHERAVNFQSALVFSDRSCNQYVFRTMSPLAQLYSTSVLEHHHFDQCIMILNTKVNTFCIIPVSYEVPCER